MVFSLLTYNTLFNAAIPKLGPIIDRYHPDILCLQEVATDEANLKRLKKYGYTLADYSNSFIKFGNIYGVATYFNSEKFKLTDATSLRLGNNFVEFLFTMLQIMLGYNKPKTILRTDFVEKGSKKKVSICNTHLYVVGSNALRINHIRKALKSIDINSIKSLILTGDFNYLPYQRRKLDVLMKKLGLFEATKNIMQTIKFNDEKAPQTLNSFQKISLKLLKKFVEQIKIDYIFYKGLKLKKTERVEVRYSDHYPIISTFVI